MRSRNQFRMDSTYILIALLMAYQKMLNHKKSPDFHRDSYYIYSYKLYIQRLSLFVKKEIKPVIICMI